MLLGGSELFPGSVLQMPPQAGGVLPRFANPLKLAGAGPPEREFARHH
jgi:hypothetical protein